ncbi:MAG: TolC family protein [Bacteroidales bacterium]
MILNRFFTVLLSVSCALSLMAQEQADTLTLTLDQCVEIALSDNPTIKVADMEIERVDYSKKETIGMLLPTIAFDGTYSRTLEKQVMYMGDQEFAIGTDNSYSTGFTASLPLIYPQLWKSLKLSDVQIYQMVESARDSKITLVNSVENAYYALLLAKDAYHVIQENMDNALFNAKIYEGKYKVGTASEYDVLRSSVQVKNIEPELLKAEIAVKQATLQLKILMGMGVTVPVNIKGSLAEYEDMMFEYTLAADRSIENNSDLRQLDLQTDYLQAALDIQRMEWYPTLALGASYNWNAMSNGSMFSTLNWTPSSSVALSLSFTLFNGGQRYNKVKQSQIMVNEMSYQREYLVNSLNMQVELQIDNMEQMVKQISSSSDGVAQADKAYQIMQKSFEIGAAAYLDLRDSELALTAAQLSYYQAIYDYMVAKSNLKLLVGGDSTIN